MLHVHSLKTDYSKDPEGVGKRPHFGWILEGDGTGIRQTSFRFQLAQDDAFSIVLFDSGVVLSDESAHYVPDDLPLTPANRYYWRVRVVDNRGRESGWSDPATFVTSLLDRPWQAEFISAETDADADSSRGTRVFRSYRLEKPVRAAYAFTTALGVYHFYINGQKVGDDQLAPGWTSYHHRLLYQTYEITRLLTSGENEFSALLGAGWYKGEMGFLHNRNNYGKKTAFLCQIELYYTDGSRETLCSDASWQGQDTPVLFSEIYHGETYDARQDFCNPYPVSTVPFAMSCLEAQSGCRVRVMETFSVREIIKTPRGETVLDFGQNLTGCVRLSVSGRAGEEVVLRCFEVLDRDGNVYTENLRSARQTIRYILRGGERETYQPLFTFQGFRYVHVEAFPGEPAAEDFTALVIHSDMEQTCTFETSNEDVNQLYHNILWGLKGNFLDIPTDCPQRDERLGWTGDAQIFCPTACFLMNTYVFFRKWLRDLAADQTPEGGVPHVIPDIISTKSNVSDNWLLKSGAHSAAAWADAAVLNPWNLYLAYGDCRILEEQYDSMRAWVEFMHRHADGPVWRYQLQFGDWVALDAEEGSYYGATPNDLIASAYYAFVTGIFARIAAILGREEDHRTYAALHHEIVEGFHTRFFRADGSMTADTQTAHIIALHFGLVPEQWREKTAAHLVELLQKEGGHLVTGFVGTPYFTYALSENGYLREAYDLLLRDDFPSWLYQVKMGATTVWEHWDGIKPDGSMWSADMNSFNHYSYGSIGKWIFSFAGGIDTDEACPGYRCVRIAPRAGGNLSFVRTVYRSLYGDVRVSWQKSEENLVLELTIPCNAEALIDLSPYTILDSGVLCFTDGTALAGSGKYRILCRAAQ